MFCRDALGYPPHREQLGTSRQSWQVGFQGRRLGTPSRVLLGTRRKTRCLVWTLAAVALLLLPKEVVWVLGVGCWV